MRVCVDKVNDVLAFFLFIFIFITKKFSNVRAIFSVNCVLGIFFLPAFPPLSTQREAFLFNSILAFANLLF